MSFDTFGGELVRSALPTGLVARLREAAQAKLTEIDALVEAHGAFAVDAHLAPGVCYVPTASSVNLEGVDGWRDWIAAIAASPAGERIRAFLGERVVCNLEHAWLRRQFPPDARPQYATPHEWHQDGALGYDFVCGGGPGPDLLEMVVCWMALTPCGEHAPGLELACERIERLWQPHELPSAGDHFDDLWAPALAPGDVLLMRGEPLHRTHVTPSMTRVRLSLGMRCFRADARPVRLEPTRYVEL